MDDRADAPLDTAEVGLRVEEWRDVPGYGALRMGVCVRG